MPTFPPIIPSESPNPTPKKGEVVEVNMWQTDGVRAKVEGRSRHNAIGKDAVEGAVAGEDALELGLAIVVQFQRPSLEYS